MPHVCVKCKKLHPDQSEAIFKGCNCGARIFYFLKSELPVAQVNLSKSIESPLPEITEELIELSREKPVVIDSDDPANIRVLESGSYEINIPALFKGDPVIVRTDSEVYYVKLPAPKK